MMKSTQATPYWFSAGIVSFGAGCGRMINTSKLLSKQLIVILQRELAVQESTRE
jgi:hypothetical protein